MSCRQPKPCDCKKCERNLIEIRKKVQERKQLMKRARECSMECSKEYIYLLLKDVLESHPDKNWGLKNG